MRGFTLFVANLPFDCNHEDVFKIFQRHGKVNDIYIPYFPNSSRPRGYAFVRFQYEDEGRAAIGVLDGRKIDDTLRNKPTQKPPIPAPINQTEVGNREDYTIMVNQQAVYRKRSQLNLAIVARAKSTAISVTLLSEQLRKT
ncbi:serine/arginine-rich SC35-like splicing factor SCL30 [Magnolia sinica]|uniref:serine/arginine-rich SC35-like splicing factor SCL30 n=1 Tax=Magnolia sinica TaxID=86752 RepID=UPI0026593DFF|nr:serine/arginine-rich SC35-like splicing factor SCL30 [Magnolia sinica]